MTGYGAWEPDLVFYEVLSEDATEFFGCRCMDWNNVVEGAGNYRLPEECDHDSNNPKQAEQNQGEKEETIQSGSPNLSQQEIDNSLREMKKMVDTKKNEDGENNSQEKEEKKQDKGKPEKQMREKEEGEKKQKQGETEEEKRGNEEREKKRKRLSDEFLSGKPPPQGYVGVRLRGRFKLRANRSVCKACKQYIDNDDYDCVFHGFESEFRGKTRAWRTYYHGNLGCLQKLPWFAREEFLVFAADCPNLDVRCLKNPLQEIWDREEKERRGLVDSDVTEV